MSLTITVRDSDIIAAEINTIKEDTRRILIASAIRIGGKLVEAKSMVDHGEWGKWLEEKVDYSQSTANNLMQLYREYGENQASFFDNWTGSETFAKLTYTQHMALLALPFADRLEFAETHQVENLSTRELEKAVREELEKTQAALTESEKGLDAALQRETDLEEKLRNQEADMDSLREDLARAQSKIKDSEAEVKSYAKDVAAAQKAKDRAEKSEKNALGLVKKLETELATAKEAEKIAREELSQALENPTIPDAVMEQMRSEVAADAARKATEEIQKQLDSAKAEAEAATRAKAEAEAQLAAAQKQAKMNDPDIIAFQTMAKQLDASYSMLNDYRLKVAATNADAGERLKRFQTALLTQWIDALTGA